MKIVIAGGTIFKDYDVDTGLMEHKGSNLTDCLEDMMLNDQPDVRFWGMHDSLEMTDSDRKSLYQFCKKIKDRRILVIHGTDTMTETHEYFPTDLRKTIVFTGALYPLCVKGTEAEFNLGFGIACTKTLPDG